MDNEFKVEEDKNNFEIHYSIDEENMEKKEKEKEKQLKEKENEKFPCKIISYVNSSGIEEKIRIYDSQIINNNKFGYHSVQSEKNEIDVEKLINLNDIGNKYIDDKTILENKKNESKTNLNEEKENNNNNDNKENINNDDSEIKEKKNEKKNLNESQRQLEKNDEMLDSSLYNKEKDNKETSEIKKNENLENQDMNNSNVKDLEKKNLESEIKEKLIKEIINERENKNLMNETPKEEEKKNLEEKQISNINDNLMEIPINKDIEKEEKFEHEFIEIVRDDNHEKNKIIKNHSIVDESDICKNPKYIFKENKKNEDNNVINDESKVAGLIYPKINLDNNNEERNNNQKNINEINNNNKYPNYSLQKEENNNNEVKKEFETKKGDDEEEIKYPTFTFKEKENNINEVKKEFETKKDDDEEIKYPTFTFKEKKETNINEEKKEETKKGDDEEIKYPTFTFKEKENNINEEKKEFETQKGDDEEIKYPTFTFKEKKENINEEKKEFETQKGDDEEIKYPIIENIEVLKMKYDNNEDLNKKENEEYKLKHSNNDINNTNFENSNLSNNNNEKNEEIKEIKNNDDDNTFSNIENTEIKKEKIEDNNFSNIENTEINNSKMKNSEIKKEHKDNLKNENDFEIHSKTEISYIKIDENFIKKSENINNNDFNINKEVNNNDYNNNEIIKNPNMKVSIFDAEEVIQNSNLENKINKNNDFIEIRYSEIKEPLNSNVKNINNLNFTDNSIINLFDKILKKNKEYLKDKEFFIISEKENVKDYIGSHKLYEIIFVNKLGNKEFKCLRRYDNFDKLNNKLKIKYPYVVIPKLTPKNPYIKIMNYNDQFYNDRRLQLEFYLNFIYNQEIIKDTKEFFKFINDANFDETYFQKIEKNIPNFSSSTGEIIKNKFFTVLNYLGNGNKIRKLNDSEILIKKMSIHYKNIIKKYEEIKNSMCDYINSIKIEQDNHKDLSDLLFYLKDSFENVENSKENLSKNSKIAKKISNSNKKNYKIALKLKNKLEALISLIDGICSSLDNYINFIQKYNEVTETLKNAKEGKWDNLNIIVQEYDVCEIMKNNYESVLLCETNNYVQMFDKVTNECLKEFKDILIGINNEILNNDFNDCDNDDNDDNEF